MPRILLSYYLTKRIVMVKMIKSDILDIVHKCYKFYDLSYPVDLYALCEKLDIKVLESDIESEGYFLNRNGELYIILKNTYHNFHRKRFTFAHEIGHAILHSDSSIIKSNVDITSIFNYSKELDTVEKQANYFASELLCPSKFLQREIPNKSLNFEIIDEIAAKFKISRQVAAIKCVSNSKTENELLLFYDNNDEFKWFVTNDLDLNYSDFPNDLRDVDVFLDQYFDKKLDIEKYHVENYGTTILATGDIAFNL